MKFSSLGAVLRQELDPTRMVEERRAKVDALKEQIRNGTYAPASLAVAQSVSEEISTEVMFGAKSLADEIA
jgi:anti-sigma28 factor (negative regulator of flagellin synthesis)